MRRLLLLVLAGAVALLAIGAGTGLAGHANALTRQRQELMQRATEQSQVLDDYFERSRSIMLITAQNPAFAELYDLPGNHDDRIRSGGTALRQANAAMDYLEKLYPDRIGEACFIDANGAENARVVRGEWAPVDDLSPDEASNPFFHPTFALKQGQVYQAKPYVSPDTNEWVLANSTVVPSRDGVNHAIVHFEVTVESFRQEAAAYGSGPLFVVDAETGAVVIDTAQPQRTDAPLGSPTDHRFAGLVSGWKESGQLNIGGRLGAYQRVDDTQGNANHWYAVALAPSPANPLTGVGSLAIVLVSVSLLLIAYLAVVLWRGQLVLVRAAYTDALTGLHNRRRLTADLNAGLRKATEGDPLLLILCDLNGFKAYNDTFGHPAGDALLTRLGGNLSAALEGRASAYRIGGDEFCVLARPGTGGIAAVVEATVQALTERGDGFAITASHGAVLLPTEARDAAAALRLVDQRMYEQKTSGRIPADTQTTNALLRALHERDPHLTQRMSHAAELAGRVSDLLGLSPAERAQVRQAAQLHDIGKVAVPDSLLTQVPPLDPADWDFLQQCPVIGERIAAAAPALAPLAPMIRSARERFDGTGYPDRLSGDQIPLGARIIAVCSALAAMTSSRPYSPTRTTVNALAELHRAAGRQFDPRVVAALTEVLSTVGTEDWQELGTVSASPA
jgi:diguanylate cyclase (GGDEF)-like protein